MKELRAKKLLRQVLRSFTPGSVLGLLADLYRDRAAKARRRKDRTSERQHRQVEFTLFVVGLGIDPACPQ
jgi:hypothetical protein